MQFSVTEQEPDRVSGVGVSNKQKRMDFGMETSHPGIAQTMCL